MAIILGSKPVSDLDRFDDVAIGVTLPLQFGNNTFVQSFKTPEQISTNLKSLLLTRRGERIMQPLLGSGLSTFVFDFNDENLAADIEDVILTAIEPWLPFITVENIEISQTNKLKDLYRIEISITYRIGDSIDLNELTFTI